jgi:hypothetical protein
VFLIRIRIDFGWLTLQGRQLEFTSYSSCLRTTFSRKARNGTVVM